jgi:hypothetical protein
MSNGDHGMTSIQIQIFLTLLVPQAASIGFHKGYWNQGIDVE